jgi:hypothetical protein
MNHPADELFRQAREKLDRADIRIRPVNASSVAEVLA